MATVTTTERQPIKRKQTNKQASDLTLHQTAHNQPTLTSQTKLHKQSIPQHKQINKHKQTEKQRNKLTH